MGSQTKAAKKKFVPVLMKIVRKHGEEAMKDPSILAKYDLEPDKVTDWMRERAIARLESKANEKLDLRWPSQPVIRNFQNMYDYQVWESEDKAFRVGRIPSSDPYFMATRKADSPGAKEKTIKTGIRTLQEAFEAVEKYILDTTKKTPTSNVEEVVAKAHKQGFDVLPSKNGQAAPQEGSGVQIPVASGGKPATSKPAPASNAPKRTVTRGARVFGKYSVTSVLHWCGVQDPPFTDEQCRQVLDHFKIADIKPSTIRTGLTDAKNPKYSKPADLMDRESEEIHGIFGKAEKPKKKKKKAPAA
jgi:hypothetical protein